MEHNPISLTPEAATDEPAFPANPDPRPPSEKALPGLVSWTLDNSFTETQRGRHDGWTPERMRVFLEELAVHGVVANAAQAAGMSAKSAYRLRASARGRAFHLAWEGALVLARRRLADELHARAMNGCIEQVYNANGSIVGERHRYDNRLSIAVLTRLDRQVRDMGEEARVGRTVAQEWEQFLDIVEAGGDRAEAFLAAHLPAPPSPARGRGAGRGPVPPPASAAASEPAILARLARYRRYRAALPEEVATADLDPAAMARWSEEQWERAEFSGFLARLSAMPGRPRRGAKVTPARKARSTVTFMTFSSPTTRRSLRRPRRKRISKAAVSGKIRSSHG